MTLTQIEINIDPVRLGDVDSSEQLMEVNMPLTEKQTRLARIIDKHVRQIIKNGGDDEDLLVSMYDDMDTFKQLMDLSTQQEMNTLCQRYDGFYRFAKLLELLAEGIANGSIPVPR